MSSLCKISPPNNNHVSGKVVLNGSKSISNRVLIIDALCNNAIPLENLSNADDTVILNKLLKSNEPVLDAGAGGTTFRFLTAYLATQEGREVLLTGSERMQQRPIKLLVDALIALGADIKYENISGFPPLRIKGKKLKGGKIQLPADTSSQYITALLLIAPTLEDGLELELTGTIVSVPYIRMTLNILNYFGITTRFEKNIIKVEQGVFQSKPFFIEGDWSAASYYYSVAILSESAELELIGLTNQQIQGDSIIAKIAENFGVKTIYKDKRVVLEKSTHQKLDTFSFDFLECPDLAQTVIVFCAAKGTELHCKGLQTLRIKETDRITALDNELQKLGLASLQEITKNGWKLLPNQFITHNSELQTISTYEDHRMAMAFAPLTLVLKELSIKEPNVVSKSYPEFWNDLQKIGFKVETN